VSKHKFIYVIPPTFKPAKCELCGKVEELRPYGPNGESVCFACGMKDEKSAIKQFCTQALGMKESEIKYDDTTKTKGKEV
jgi:hypothetical protein